MLAIASLGVRSAPAETTFPAKPVRIILPIPAGSALDVVTRVLAEQLTLRWGQQVIVENRPGGGGAIAAQAVASPSRTGTPYSEGRGPSSRSCRRNTRRFPSTSIAPLPRLG
jgi:tripartite-type tricarboxylate transporter receptor subunit TctC